MKEDMRKCDCCAELFDANDDSETHNGGIYGENVCFKCYHADKEGCPNCESIGGGRGK